MTWFWRIYIPSAVLVLLGMLALPLGPAVELRLAPIRGPLQRIDDVTRAGNRLCWTWTFTKLRDTASDNIDAFLTVDGEPGGVTMVYDADSGRPWGITRYAVPARPEPYTLRQCAPLPPYVQATDAVVIRQVAYYPGLFGWWRLAVPFPDVVSPGVQPP